MSYKIKLVLVLCIISLLILPACIGACAKPPEAEKIEITMLTHKLGTTSYVVSFALADIINANSTRLHATAIETKGSLPNLLEWQNLEPEKQKYVIAAVPPFYVHQAAVGDPPFETPFPVPKLIARVADYHNPLITLDLNIKSGKDMAGKRVSFGTAGSGSELVLLSLTKEAWGLTKDDINLTPLSFGPGADALIDGTVDVAMQAGTMIGTTEEWQPWLPNPAMEKLLSTKKCYVITFPEEAYAKASEMTGYPIQWSKCEAQTVGKSDLPRYNSFVFSTSWFISKDMPDDVVEELCAILYENVGKFKDYHAQGNYMTQDTLTRLPRDLYHPAAIKFYGEKGETFPE